MVQHPVIVQILAETSGILKYRDQICTVIQEVSGFDAQEANELRKIMGTKNVDKLEPLKRTFLEGADKRSFESEIAEEIWGFLLHSSVFVQQRVI